MLFLLLSWVFSSDNARFLNERMYDVSEAGSIPHFSEKGKESYIKLDKAVSDFRYEKLKTCTFQTPLFYVFRLLPADDDGVVVLCFLSQPSRWHSCCIFGRSWI